MNADKEVIMNAISQLGFEVFRNGQFHWNSSNTPDMQINKNGSIHCWTSSPFKNNTSNHGDLIDFIQMVNRSSFLEAKKDAERLTGLKLPSLDSYKDNGYQMRDDTNKKVNYISESFIKNFDIQRKENFERYKELLNKALPSLSFDEQKEVALKYQIGYIKQSDRLSMPIRDETNKIVTLWKYNSNPKPYVNNQGVEVTPGKVLFTKGRERSPFNLSDLNNYRKDIDKEIFLCAGEKDTINMIGNGYRAITLGSENENLKEKYKPYFKDLNIVIAYDNDDAGVKGAEKIATQLKDAGVKEIKTWNWDKIKANQGLELSKGFDMTDYLTVIKKHNLEFDKTNYQENTNISTKEEKMRADNFKKFREEMEKETGFSFNEVQKSNNQAMKKKWLDTWNQKYLKEIEDNENKKTSNSELLKVVEKNSEILEDLEKKANEYKKVLKDFSVNQTEEKKDFVENKDFIKNIEADKVEELELESEVKAEPEVKASFISHKIDTLKDATDSLTSNVKSFKDAINFESKQEMFKRLEKEIAEFKEMITQLKEENKLLKQELELLIEHDKKQTQKQELEKDNLSLKDKIEALKEKTSNSKKEFEKSMDLVKNKDDSDASETVKKTNKITYEHTQDI